MKLTSTAFEDQKVLPTKFTCQGEGVNPPLTISGVPETGKSLALIVDDPDAPAGTWTHWTLWNLPPTTVEIPENWVIPDSIIEGTTSFGEQTYGSPCPPNGSHRYFFKIFALDQLLDLPSSSSAEELEQAMQGHVLDSAMLMGTYQRTQSAN
jgi:hypothetical protein